MTERPLTAAFAADAEIAALFAPAAEIACMLHFEASLAEAEAEAGLIPAKAAIAIAAALGAFVPDFAALAQGLVRDGVAVPELVRQIRAAVGEPYARFVHVGATSQDVIDTSLMLRLREVLRQLGERLARLLGRLGDLALRDGALVMMAHTRMQAALPFTAAEKLATWRAPLEAHAARLGKLSRETLALQLGGPIGNGDGFHGALGQVSVGLADRLGLSLAAPWHSDRTRILDVAHGLALLTGTLGKLGQDIALLSQSEVGAIRLANAGASSAMAHKQNPVGAEVLVALARLNAGLAGTLQQAMVHENERSGAAWTLEWLVLPQMTEATGAALRTAETLLSGARFTPDARNLNPSPKPV